MGRRLLHEAGQADEEGSGVCDHRGGLGLGSQAAAGGPVSDKYLHTLAILLTGWNGIGTPRMGSGLEL